MDDIKKSVDESAFLPSAPDFNFFISTLALQVSIFLGDMADPTTNKKTENLIQAKFIIDTLDMLKEKTKGNLTDDEAKLIENVLFELKSSYVTKVNKTQK